MVSATLSFGTARRATRLALATATAAAALVVVGCGGSNKGSGSETGAGSPAAQKPAPPPARMGVPVRGARWELTVKRAYKATRLSDTAQTYTPKGKRAFLVVETKLRSLQPGSKGKYSTKRGVLLDQSGTSIRASGGGFASGPLKGLCAGCSAEGTIRKGSFSPGFVFLLPRRRFSERFKFQFEDLTPVPLELTRRSG